MNKTCVASLLLIVSICRSSLAQPCNSWQSFDSGAVGQRENHAMVYDAGQRRTLLFGGGSLGTWGWDGNAWHLLANAQASPSTAGYPVMAYDNDRQVVVLFIGTETWEWNGQAWTRKATFGPPSRFGGAMVYDTVRRVSVLFGGATGSGGPIDTWAWNGGSWAQLANTGPSFRYQMPAAFDLTRGRIVLFGGAGAPADLWEWDGTEWIELASPGPGPMRASPATFSPSHGEVFFWGQASSPSQVWGWNGTTWNCRLVANGPSVTAGSSAVWDTYRNRFVLYGGNSSTTTTWELELGVPPMVTLQPTPATVGALAPFSLSCVGIGSGSLVYRWRRNGVPLNDSMTVLGTSTPTLMVTEAVPEMFGAYDCLIANPCGIVMTAPVSVGPEVPQCPVDFNADGGIDFGDVEAFFERWENGC